MTTRITHQLAYDAPAAEVNAMLTDAEFRELVCARMKVVRSEVTVEPVDGAIEVMIAYAHRASGLPSFATKLLGEEIEIVQRETWISPTRADVHVSIPGKPGEMSGTTTLRESDGRTVELVDLEVAVRIPLVGGKLESLVRNNLLRALETEHAAGRDYLSR